MAKSYSRAATTVSTRTEKVNKTVPQSQPLVGRESEMAPNNAGGFAFTLDKWGMLNRFLILGTEGGTYYVSQKALTLDNTKNVQDCIKADGVRTVKVIAEISKSGRAPKNDPALFALALVFAFGDPSAKAAAREVIKDVARTGTHLLHLASYVNELRGWGRSIRGAFSSWYVDRSPKSLAMQLVKYANRDGWTHKDVLRLAHVKASGDTDALLRYAVGKEVTFNTKEIADFMDAVAKLKKAIDSKTAIKLITDYQLPREVVPTELLNKPEVWEAMLPHMGMIALVRNIATMTRVGFIAPNSNGMLDVLQKLSNAEEITKSKIHPIQVLAAYSIYSKGQSSYRVQDTKSWTPVKPIVDELNALYYKAFGNINPTFKRYMLGLDLSGSMSWGEIAGIPGLMPSQASAAMAMVTARLEPAYEIMGFAHVFRKLKVHASMSLEDVLKEISDQTFGGTDCSLPMKYALKNKIPVDAFCVYTDNETWFGDVHPSVALKNYRQAMGIDAKLIVVGMTATNFTIADPKDPGMLDVVGFDTATPNLIGDFVR